MESDNSGVIDRLSNSRKDRYYLNDINLEDCRLLSYDFEKVVFNHVCRTINI